MQEWQLVDAFLSGRITEEQLSAMRPNKAETLGKLVARYRENLAPPATADRTAAARLSAMRAARTQESATSASVDALVAELFPHRHSVGDMVRTALGDAFIEELLPFDDGDEDAVYWAHFGGGSFGVLSEKDIQ